MKKTTKGKSDSDMLEEYDFSQGVRGKYGKRHAAGTNVVLLEPDVAKVFRDSASVNTALRAIAQLLALGVGPSRTRSTRKKAS